MGSGPEVGGQPMFPDNTSNSGSQSASGSGSGGPGSGSGSGSVPGSELGSGSSSEPSGTTTVADAAGISEKKEKEEIDFPPIVPYEDSLVSHPVLVDDDSVVL